MKNIVLYIGMCILVLTSMMHEKIFAQQTELVGTWTGTFMDQFEMIVDFETSNDGKLTGRLQLYDKSNRIQDDLLTRVNIKGNKVTFFIPAKNTDFVAEKLKGTLTGHFIFPDKSQHFIFLVQQSPKEEEAVDNSALLLKTITRSQAEEDLVFLAKKLVSMHPSFYAYNSQEAFDQLLIQTKNSFEESMTIPEYYSSIVDVVSSVGCSHTVIRLPEKIRKEFERAGNYFPAKLYFMDSKAYFISSVEQTLEIEAGDEILLMNGVGIDQLLSSVFESISVEGNTLSKKYYYANKNFPELYVILDNSEEFEVLVRHNNKTETKVEMQSCAYAEIESLYGSSSANKINDFPLTYWSDQDEGISILTIPTFACRDINRYNWFLDSVFVSMGETKTEHLIIDLRGNDGGHPLFAAQLFSYLTDDPFVYFDDSYFVEELALLYSELQPNPIHYQGKTFVLVDGGCLSTTGHLISLLKYHNLATIIGQEPGSSYTCNDKSQQFVLPNSGIELNVPTTVFTTAVDGFDSNTSMLNIALDPKIEDVITNSDPDMETTKKIIEVRNSADL